MSVTQDAVDRVSAPSVKGDLRLAGYSGIVFFVWLLLAGVLVGGLLPMPTFADTAAYHRQYYVDHATLVLLHAWFSGLFWAFSFLCFATGLRHHLETDSEKPPGIWPSLATAGAILTVGFGGTGLVFQSVATTVARDASDEMLRVLARMMVIVDATLLYWGLSLFSISASMAILRSGRFGRGLSLLGFASAVFMVIGAAWPLLGDDRGPLAGVGFIGLILVGVFILLTAISLLRATAHSPSTTLKPSS